MGYGWAALMLRQPRQLLGGIAHCSHPPRTLFTAARLLEAELAGAFETCHTPFYTQMHTLSIPLSPMFTAARLLEEELV